MILFSVIFTAIIAGFYEQVMAGKVVSTVVRVGDISYYMRPLVLSVRFPVVCMLELLLTIRRILNANYWHSTVI